jgi:hypothetical protein
VKLGGDRGVRLTAKARTAGNAAQRAGAQARAADLADTVKELQAAGCESLLAASTGKRTEIMMHPLLPGPRPLAVPGIGFPQNISIGSDVRAPAAFGDSWDNHRGASTRPIERII